MLTLAASATKRLKAELLRFRRSSILFRAKRKECIWAKKASRHIQTLYFTGFWRVEVPRILRVKYGEV